MRLRHASTLSGKGEKPDQFCVRLAGIAVDAEDCLLAVGDREVKRFTPDGNVEIRFPTRDAGWSIAADSESIWVGMHGSVERYDLAGNPVGRIEDPGRLGRVTALAVHGQTLVGADATNRTIHIYKDGVWLREVGRETNTRGFMIPNGALDLALEPQRGSFVVAHPQKHRVERYGLDGELINLFGRYGMEDPADFNGCCNPTNITALQDGLIAVSEKAPPCLKVITTDGALVTQLEDAVFDANAKNIDLAADGRGRLYATDPLRCTVEVFELATTGG
jgi:hypothetical protein